MAYLVLSDYIDPGNSGGSVPAPVSVFEQFPVDSQVVFNCPKCEEIFLLENDLRAHLFNQHPVSVPQIFHQCQLLSEDITKIRQTSLIQSADFKFKNTQCFYLDGKEIELKELLIFLEKQDSACVKLTLKNSDGVSRKHMLDILVFNSEDIFAIDSLFFKSFEDGVTLEKVDGFLDQVREFLFYDKYKDYISGLINYMYAILAKNRCEMLEKNTDNAKERMGKAFYSLISFDCSQLASTISAIICFNMNDFEFDYNSMGSRQLSFALSQFKTVLANPNFEIIPSHVLMNKMEGYKIPIDKTTSFIFDWFVLSESQRFESLDELKRAREEAILDEDKFKISILLADVYMSNAMAQCALDEAARYKTDNDAKTWIGAVKTEYERLKNE